MFTFWKKRSKHESFRRLAPDGLVDLHSHVLPGLDDGAQNEGESRELFGILASLGYVTVVATPHFDPIVYEPSLVRQRELIGDLEQSGVSAGVRVLPGAEIQFDARFVEEAIDGRYPTLGEGRRYLVEFGFTAGSVPPRMEEIVFKLRARGVGLVLAHPERCPDLRDDPARLGRLREAGMLFQIGVASLAGKHGDSVQESAMQFVDAGLVDLAASDIHRASDEPHLRNGLRILSQLVGDGFSRLVSETPARILNGTYEEMQPGPK